MIDHLGTLFATADLEPFGAALGWRPSLVWLHAVSHSLIALACLAIGAGVGVVLARRRDLNRSARLSGGLFIAFMLAIALLNVAELITIWHPLYGLQALLKLAAAVVACVTAISVWPQLPRLLALPSPRDLSRANLALVQANASLETSIAWRTHEIERAKQRFEQAMARSNTTVFTQDTELRYTWIYNPRAGSDPEAMLGRTAEEVYPSQEVDESLALRRRALATGETISGTVAVPTEDAGLIYLDMTVSPTLDQSGDIDGVLCTSVDVTEKRLFEIRLAAMAAQLAAAYQRFDLALEESPISVFEQDADLRYSFIHNPPSGIDPESFVGRTDAEVFNERDAARIEAPKRRVLASGQRETAELEIEIDGEPRDFEFRLDPRADESGAVTGVLGIALDITERRRDERRMRLMMRELTHRSKNLLAVIQAMARKTASLSDDTEQFVADFSARLRSMSAAHDLLVSQSWHGADLGDLIRASVAQTIAPTAEQVRIDGPPLLLAPDTAQNLGLAFHELATNATKYGALSADAGEIAVRWSLEGDEVHIRWEERGGPKVGPPERLGFGRVLLEKLVGATLNGSVDLDFRREGLVCEIVFPRDRLIAA
jgi:PAS domain S-box-containing protein